MFHPCGRIVAAVATAGVVTAAVAGLNARGPTGASRWPFGQRGQDTRRPTFRTAANLVRLDVYPLLDGRSVAGLTLGDFEILEDGVPQKVATFEHVAVSPPNPTAVRREPRSLRESVEMAARGRNRLFVLFLDTNHVTDEVAAGDGLGWARRRGRGRERPLEPGPVERGLAQLFDRVVGLDDLFALMTPEMDVDDLTFVRRTGAIEEVLNTAWGRQIPGKVWIDADLEPEEEQWFACFPPDDPLDRYSGMVDEMIARRREAQSLGALRRLVNRLAELRDERKAVLVVSEGWPLFRENRRLARPVKGDPLPTGSGSQVGPDGKLVSGNDPRSGTVDLQACDLARAQLATINNEREFRVLPEEANRANVSFYPVYPHELAAPVGPIGGHGSPSRQEALRDLAAATDGVVVSGAKDYTAGLKRLFDDSSDYYLIGYFPTNTRNDGLYRKVTVRVNRPGVVVRTRPGYRAPTEEDVRTRSTAEARPDPEEVELVDALATLDRLGGERVLHVRGTWSRSGAAVADPSLRGATISLVVELDASASRRSAWGESGSIRASLQDSGGRVLATGAAEVSRLRRSATVRFGQTPVGPGRYIVRAALESADGAIGEQVPVIVPDVEGLLGGVELFRKGGAAASPARPTADLRFRRSELVRVEVAVTPTTGPATARLLDRQGQPVTIPVTSGQIDEPGHQVVTAEYGLAPLAPGDYVIELAAGAGTGRQRTLIPFRLIL